MIRALWGRITGKDKRLTVPDQQCAFLGRIGDYTIIYPYGLYCDLPNDVLLRQVGRGAAIPTTITRPDDIETGEPVLFHPVNKTRIILRNNGDIDIIGTNNKNINVTGDVNYTAGGDFNIQASNMNIDLTGDLNIDTNRMTISTVATPGVTHDGTTIGNDHIHSQGNDSDGDSEVDTGTPHS